MRFLIFFGFFVASVIIGVWADKDTYNPNPILIFVIKTIKYAVIGGLLHWAGFFTPINCN